MVVTMLNCVVYPFATYTYLYVAKIWVANSTNYFHNSPNSFCCKFEPQDCNILCMCSNVQQIFVFMRSTPKKTVPSILHIVQFLQIYQGNLYSRLFVFLDKEVKKSSKQLTPQWGFSRCTGYSTLSVGLCLYQLNLSTSTKLVLIVNQ